MSLVCGSRLRVPRVSVGTPLVNLQAYHEEHYVSRARISAQVQSKRRAADTFRD
jgi:hypothetical protein